MKYISFRKNVLEYLEKYKSGKYINVSDGSYKGIRKGYIFPKEMRYLNLLPLATGINFKDYDMYANHLNSSQIMCINFFSPLKYSSEILIEILNRQLKLNLEKDIKVRNMEFEFNPDRAKKTHFDLFIELTNDEKFYFEVKYTEPCFGGIIEDKRYPERYQRAWENFYQDKTSKSMHLKSISQTDFYCRYQINRNIAYIKSLKDHVCFVYPFDNSKLQSELEQVEYANVHKINWDDLCNTALTVTEGSIYNKHFKDFKEKYLEYCRE